MQTLTIEDERKKLIFKKRFVRKHGEQKWIKLQHYLDLGLREVDICRLMNFPRTTARYYFEIILNKKRNVSSGGGRDWTREKVRRRDGYTCQICFKVWKPGERRFDVHHLDENHENKGMEKYILKYDRENTDKLITLCHKCHMGINKTTNSVLQSSLKQ
jgi:hypothetical protein